MQFSGTKLLNLQTKIMLLRHGSIYYLNTPEALKLLMKHCNFFNFIMFNYPATTAVNLDTGIHFPLKIWE